MTEPAKKETPNNQKPHKHDKDQASGESTQNHHEHHHHDLDKLEAEDVHGTAAGGLRSALITFLRRMGAQLYRNPLKLFRQSQVKFGIFDIFRHAAESAHNPAAHKAHKEFHHEPKNPSTPQQHGAKKTVIMKQAMHVAKQDGYLRTFRKAFLPFGINIFIGMSMFTTYDVVVEYCEHSLGCENHAEVPLWSFYLGGGAAGVVQSTLASPYANVYADYSRHHHSYRDSLRSVWKQGRLFHHYPRLLATEICGLTLFFGGYETAKRVYCEHLFYDKLKVLNVVGAGLTAGMLYNIGSYPVSRMHLGPRQAFKGLFPKKIFVSMPANAIGFLLYELTLDHEDTFLDRKKP
eukprot:PhF_6_TR43567/c0_g1_i1/m.66906